MGRLWDGIIRYSANFIYDLEKFNPKQAQAQSIAFLFWGLADVAIIYLLVVNTIKYLTVPENESRNAIGQIFASSLPRLLLMSLNTCGLIILGQFDLSKASDGINNLNHWLIAIKCSYPLILLFDILTTKQMVMKMQSTREYESTDVSFIKSGPNVFERSLHDSKV